MWLHAQHGDTVAENNKNVKFYCQFPEVFIVMKRNFKRAQCLSVLTHIKRAKIYCLQNELIHQFTP